MLDEFKTYMKEHGKAKNTVDSYCWAVGAYAKWYVESFGEELRRLYRANVLDYISYLRAVKGLSNRSVNAKLAALYCLNEFWVEAGIQTDIVVDRKDYLKVQLAFANPSTTSKEEVEAFRQKVLISNGPRDHAIVTILAYAGLRISEAMDLKLSDVDLVGMEITVPHGKGDKPRVVYIGDKIVNAVREYLKVRPQTDCPYLFISRKGGQLSRGQVNRIFNDYSETLTPHKLRHFFCSTALESGYSYHELANQAGHSNIHTTLLYTNPTRQKMKDKANKL